MAKRLLVFGVLGALAGPAGAAEGVGSLTDYDARLSEVAAEVRGLRREVEALVAELAARELGRVLVFLETPAPTWRDQGVKVEVDGRTVFARGFSPAEADVFQRGLPLEVADLWLPAGEHRVSVMPLGGGPAASRALTVERGKMVNWVARSGAAGAEWRAE